MNQTQRETEQIERMLHRQQELKLFTQEFRRMITGERFGRDPDPALVETMNYATRTFFAGHGLQTLVDGCCPSYLAGMMQLTAALSSAAFGAIAKNLEFPDDSPERKAADDCLMLFGMFIVVATEAIQTEIRALFTGVNEPVADCGDLPDGFIWPSKL